MPPLPSLDPTVPCWRDRVGAEAPHAVTVYEHPDRDRVLYLQWRADTDRGRNWRRRSLGWRLYDDRGRRLAGRVLADALARARREAEAQYLRNVAGLTGGDADAPVAAPAPDLTLAAGLLAVQDPQTGAFTARTRYHRHVLRHARVALAIIGPARTWASLAVPDWVRLWRTRFRQLRAQGAVGLAGGLAVVDALARVASALRAAEALPETVGHPPRAWRTRARDDFAALHGAGAVPDPQRPRHTVDELRAILRVAPTIDPRLGLALTLGAELRPGQVLRATRADVTLPPWPADGDPRDADADLGTVVVRGRKKKGGTVVALTAAQRRALDAALDPRTGYLRLLEAAYQAGQLTDYPLFPGGRFSTRARRDVAHARAPGVAQGTPIPPVAPPRAAMRPPCTREHVTQWFHAAEAKAQVPRVEGRAWYGLRRATVDAADAANADLGALAALGGWTDEATPRRIYRARTLTAHQRAARDLRAQIRGEDAEAS